MKLRHILPLACTLSLGLTATAWAVPVDAGSTDAAGDATATAPDATTGDTGAPDLSKFDPCWVSKCPTQLTACEADPICMGIVACDYDSTCLQALKIAQADDDLAVAFQKCGGLACINPSAGSCVGKCGNFIQADKCHCDDACITYGDCCADQATICGPGSCAKSDCSDGSTGVYADGSASQCTCDSAGDTAGTSCPDYATTCAGKTPTCTPACTNADKTPKACGPDGCGGTCGTCAAGQKCVSAVCTGGTTGGADATGGSDTGATAGADASGTVDDTAATGTGGTTSTTTKSSGCTAGSTGNGAGWLSAILALGCIVAMRRRRA